MQQSKCCALPLGDSPLFGLIIPYDRDKGWVEGLEPSASRATIWRASQLRHTHHNKIMSSAISTDDRVCSKGFEPPTHGLEGRCSIQLSYEHITLTEAFSARYILSIIYCHVNSFIQFDSFSDDMLQKPCYH